MTISVRVPIEVPMTWCRTTFAALLMLSCTGALLGCKTSLDLRAPRVAWPIEPEHIVLPVGDRESIAAVAGFEPLAETTILDPELPGGAGVATTPALDVPSVPDDPAVPGDAPAPLPDPLADAGGMEPTPDPMPADPVPTDPVPTDPPPTDPAPAGLEPLDLPPTPEPTAPTEPAPFDMDPPQPRGPPSGLVPRQPVQPLPRPTPVPATPMPTPRGPVVAECPPVQGVPPRPPPPQWDPARDLVRRLGPDGRPVGGSPATTDPAPTPGDVLPPPAGDPVAPPAGDPWLPGNHAPPVADPDAPPAGVPPSSPWLSDTTGASRPRAPVPATPAPAEQPDDPGLPPGGVLPTPLGPPPAGPTPTAPSVDPVPRSTPPRPAPPAGDPWLPGGGSTQPPPVDPPPAVDGPPPADPASPAGDPWLPGGGSTQPPAVPDPAPTAPDTPPVPEQPAGDPWLPGGGTTTAPPPVADTPPAPRPDDPWLPAGDPSTRPPAEPADPLADPAPVPTHAATVMEQVTLLRDAPGNAEVTGYPAHLMPSAEPGMALTPGRKPAVVVFYDDSRRESDLLAAEVLPVLARYRDKIDFVAVDRSAGATPQAGVTPLIETYLGGVPTLVVLDRNRKTRLYNKTGDLTARRLDAALNEVTRAPVDPVPSPPVDPLPVDPPPADTRPTDPTPPSDPTPPADPGGDAPRPGMSFTPPLGYTAKQHVDRLRSNPGDARVPGYPSDIVPSAKAETVLSSGHRPVVLIFYDNTSKASDLQAADFLPVLIRRKSEVDLVFVDVNAGANWNKAQKTVVRTYYNFYVPTTVVLAANRAPVKSWYSRIKAADLERAIDEALLR